MKDSVFSEEKFLPVALNTQGRQIETLLQPDYVKRSYLVKMLSFFGFLLFDKYSVESVDNIIYGDNSYLVLLHSIVRAKNGESSILEIYQSIDPRKFKLDPIKDAAIKIIHDKQKREAIRSADALGLLDILAEYASTFVNSNNEGLVYILSNSKTSLKGIKYNNKQVIQLKESRVFGVGLKVVEAVSKKMMTIDCNEPKRKRMGVSIIYKYYVLANRILVFGVPRDNIMDNNDSTNVFLGGGQKK